MKKLCAFTGGTRGGSRGLLSRTRWRPIPLLLDCRSGPFSLKTRVCTPRGGPQQHGAPVLHPCDLNGPELAKTCTARPRQHPLPQLSICEPSLLQLPISLRRFPQRPIRVRPVLQLFISELLRIDTSPGQDRCRPRRSPSSGTLCRLF